MEQANSSLSLVALVVAICALGDVLISKREQDRIRTALLKGWFILDETTVAERLQRSANAILDVFDIVYGQKHWSIRCFIRNAFVSAVVILLLNLTFWNSILNYNHVLDLRTGAYFRHPAFDAAFASIAISLLTNIVIDFFALWKSRYILSKSRFVKPIYHLLLLFIDLLSSYGFYIIIMAIGAISVQMSLMPDARVVLNALREHPLRELMAASAIPYFGLKSLIGVGSAIFPPLGVSLLSTLSTSAIFATYNVLVLIRTSVHFSRIRLMSVFESLFESKAMFTTIGGVTSASIVVVKTAFRLLSSHIGF